MDIANFLTSIAVVVFTAVITSVITVYLAFRKYKSEKWWDKKANCYLDTIEALNNMMQYCDAILQGEQESEALLQTLQQEFNQGKLSFEKQTNIGSLLLSDDAQKNLLELDAKINAVDHKKNLGFKKIAIIRVAVEECLDAFIINAQRDLK